MQRGFGYQNRRNAGFSPASLFLGGTVNGAWFDPSDATTLFTDRAGTTPCGTPGGGSVVPVGLMLDKSQGLVLGPEICPNGTFDNATGWTLTAGASISGGKLNFSAAAAQNPNAFIALTGAANGDVYSITFTVSDYVSGQVNIRLYSSGSQSVPVSANGTYTVLLAVPVSNANLGIATIGASTTLSIDNLSVKKYLGNHAIAANDTTARPELRARVNLLERSEEFDNAYWTKGNTTVIANAAVAPDGTTTADLIYPSVTGTFRSVYRAFSGANSISISVKASGKTWISMMDLAGSSAVAWFDVANGALGTVAAGYTATISAQGSGWYRCTLVANSGTFAFAQFNVVDANGSNTGTANGTDGVLLWGADGRPTNIGTAMPTYQRISDANTYDAVGFPRYLACNGTSSAMSTPGNVNLSGTDKVTVFAGVRKLAEASYPTIVEFSVNSSVNTGSFSAYTSGSSTPRYPVFLFGTASTGYEPQTYAAPISNVLAVGYDIGAADRSTEVIPRINGVVNQTNPVGAAAAGTGNFGAYPLFIGSRNNSSLFLNGNLYSLIVVGSAVSAGQISATEQWVAGKTGITI